MNKKTLSAILFLILLVFIAFDANIILQSKNSAPAPTPLPTSHPLPSLPPTTSAPREVTKGVKMEYKTAQVEIRNFTAYPNSLTIKAPVVVTWKNLDKDPHQIKGDQWQSRVLKENERFSQAFEKPGNYYYKDPQNPQLTGVIIVEE